MKIAIACDHGAFDYKETIKEMLIEEGHEVIDCGCNGTDSVDYPDYGSTCAKLVASNEVERGIVMCGTGLADGSISYKNLVDILNNKGMIFNN